MGVDRRKAIVLFKTIVLFGVACFVAGIGMASSPASAQTFQNYRCADGTHFIVAFYPYDSRAHMQIDGREATLAKRFGLSGSRYSGDGVTLTMAREGVTVRRRYRPTTACEPM